MTNHRLNFLPARPPDDRFRMGVREYQAHGGSVFEGDLYSAGTPYVGYTYAAGAQGSRLTGIIYPTSDGGPLPPAAPRTLTYYYDDGLDATISRLSRIGQEPDDGVIIFPPPPPTIFETYAYLGLSTVGGSVTGRRRTTR